MIGQELDGEEMQAVANNLSGAFDWICAVATTITVGQAVKKIGPAVEKIEPEKPVDLEARVRQLPNSAWPECYDN